MQMDHARTKITPASGKLEASWTLVNWSLAMGGLWLIAGLHLDGWAHHHISLETFFTPWHGVLYSGFLVTAAAIWLPYLNGLRRRHLAWRDFPWLASLPRAYHASLIGSVIFGLGGLVDMIWHTLFGIELSIDALLSPPHLVLALGGGLLVTGPLREALYRDGERHAPGLPALLSLTSLVGLLAFFSSYAHPWIEMTRPAYGGGLFNYRLASQNEALVLAGVLLQSALLTGAVLLLVRRFRLPFGALALLFTLTTALAAAIHTTWSLVLIGLLGGLIADGLVLLLRPGEDFGATPAGSATRLFAFLVPANLYALFFLSLKQNGS